MSRAFWLIGLLAISIALGSLASVLRQRASFVEALESQGVLLAQTLSHSYANALYYADVERVRYLSVIAEERTEVAELRVFNERGRLLVDSSDSKYPEGWIEADVLANLQRASVPISEQSGGQIRILAPIRAGARLLGCLEMHIDVDASAPQMRQIVIRHALQTGIVLLLGVLLAGSLIRAVRAARELEESEARLRQLAEGMRDALWLEDFESGRVLYVSPAFETLWGADIARLGPGARHEAVVEEDRSVVSALANDPHAEISYRIHTDDGRERWIHERRFVVEDEGRPWRLVGVAADITLAKRLETRLIKAQKMESLGRMAGGLAHDFNNLLTSILGFATLGVKGPPSPERATRFFDQIRSSAERGSELTTRLLSVARRQVGEPRILEIDAEIAARLPIIRSTVGDRLEVNSHLGARATVRIDPQQLEQVLLQLAINAYEAMPDGGNLMIATSLETRRSPDERRAYDRVRIDVRDDGPGMPEHVIDHAFEPFFTSKGRASSSGLGLATCYGIVEQYGGRIEIQSTERVGTMVSVWLPQIDESDGRAVPAIARAAIDPNRKTRVLIAEDEADVLEVLEMVLRDAGYEVVVAPDGQAASEIALADTIGFDLLVSDIEMPRLRGLALAERLCSISPDLKVLLISGFTEDRLDGADLGARGWHFLGKPFSPDEFLRQVEATLAPRGVD